MTRADGSTAIVASDVDASAPTAMRRAWTLVGVALALVSVARAQPAPPCVGPSDPGGVRTQVLTGLDKYSPPAPTPPNTRVLVGVSADLKMIERVHGATGSMRVLMTQMMTWTDARLAFNSTTRNGGCYPHEHAVFPPGVLDSIWTPVYSYSNAIGTFGDAASFLVMRHDGEVTVSTQEGVETSCSFSFKKMPFDEQECHVRMELNMPVDMVDFQMASPGESLFRIQQAGVMGGTTEWNIVQVSSRQDVTSTRPPMAYVDFVVTLKRKSDYWVSFVLIPSIFLVMLSYGTFWIQRCAVPARAAFCFISYLAVINLTNGALGSLPKLSATDAYLLGVLSTSQYFCAYTVIEVVVTNYLLHIELRVEKALSEASTTEEKFGESVVDIQSFVRERCGRLGRPLINKDGSMKFSDQHVDVLSRYFFPVAYAIAMGALAADF